MMLVFLYRFLIEAIRYYLNNQYMNILSYFLTKFIL